MVVVGVFVFSLLHLAPGDPAAIIAGNYATVEDIEAIRKNLGLDEPLYVQFVDWSRQIANGDLGISIFSKLPVTRLIAQRLEPTISLCIMIITIAVVVAIPLGILAAYRAGTWIDRTVMGFAVLGFSAPAFVLGYGLIYLFAMQLKILPVQGYVPLHEGFLPFIERLIMPSVAVATVYIALIARMTRATMIDVLNEDYIRTARAKGLATFAVLARHALRNASVPIVTTIGIGVALLISGVVVIESVFAIPGVGRLTVDAIVRRDYPVIQAVIIISSGVFVFVNFLVDVLYAVLDPRIRY